MVLNTVLFIILEKTGFNTYKIFGDLRPACGTPAGSGKCGVNAGAAEWNGAVAGDCGLQAAGRKKRGETP
jgi:hypothetical protein